jgi:hypothetical protein
VRGSRATFTRLCAAAAAAFFVMPAAVAQAGGGNGSSSPSSAAQQYVEQIPSSGGSLPLGGKSTGAKPAKAVRLAPRVARAIASAGAAAPALRALATNPALGAPIRLSPARARIGGRGAGTRTAAEATNTTTIGAVFGAAYGVPAALGLCALLTLGIANVVASYRNQRRPSRPRSSV